MTPWTRATASDLSARTFDLLVIGGGITGAGIARDAALRGLAVVLVEAGDFGSGTSSRTSRLIHGGLRYLEHRHFGLVGESLRERGILLRLAPNLVRPIDFILPFYKGDRVPGWKIRLGLTLYDLLAGTGNVRRHEGLGKRALQAAEPRLKTRGLTGGARFADAQCDDARLTLAVIRGASSAGATVANYMKVTGLVREKNRVQGAHVLNALGGPGTTVRARLVINATGPWTDAIRRMEDPAAAPLLRLTKGSHVQVPQARIGNRHAILFSSPIDRRAMFLLPWGKWTYIGTTDIDTGESPDEVTPSEAEMVYLLRSANALFPGARLSLDDVTSSWAGIRPLLANGSSLPPGQISREHRIVTGSGGMLTVAGGKLTTFRLIGEQVVGAATRELVGQAAIPTPKSRTEPLPGGEGAAGLALRGAGSALGLPDPTIDYLRNRYGTETSAIYALCREDKELIRPLCAEHPAIGAQVPFAIQREFARTAADILDRRIRLTTETADQGAAAKPEVERLMARYFSGHENA
jgi:glycerol-3-phosphate dehydrogenase